MVGHIVAESSDRSCMYPSLSSGTSCTDAHIGHGRYRVAIARPSHGLQVGFFLFVAMASLPADATMTVEMIAPDKFLDDRAPPGQGEFVRYPWTIRDRAAEVKRESDGEANDPGRNVIVRDGVEFLITASPEALPPGVVAGLFVGLFSFSLTGPEDAVEQWMQDGGLPPAHNPLRHWTLFTHQFRGEAVKPDELGDACVGEAWRAEFCARVTACFAVVGGEQGGGTWRIAVPIQSATNFRLEAYLQEPLDTCDATGLASPGILGAAFSWWAPPVAERAVPSRSSLARHAAYARFRVLFVNAMSWWWGQNAKVDPVPSWTQLMAAVIDAAVSSPAASPTSHGLPISSSCPHGLWLEFGVGSGKTTAAIALRMQNLLGGHQAKLHGFDSFHGLPISWDHTQLGVGTFSTGGEVPEHLTRMENVQIHVGLFSATLRDLDAYGATPVAFAHIDVDLYESAVEVLSKIACQLYPGSILLFDELSNYPGFELSGEYRAWEYITTAYRIHWDYGGMYWQQAVPVIITQRGEVC